MVTEVDRRGNHHNRQPEYFFNGIIGHIRAGQNGWIDSWDQSSQLANYWRRYFQIPEISPYGNWHPHLDEAPESPDSVHESGMEDTDSIIANVDITPPPVQIHQLATFLWNILNNDRDANMAILERLEDTDDDLSRHPVQIFSAADLAHLASHLAESTRTLSDQARRMEAFPDEGLWALGLIQLMILPCILKPFPLQGTDNSLYRLRIWAKASRQRGVCVDHLHRCKTSFCLVDGFGLYLLDFELCLQGAQVWLWFLCQRRRPEVTVISKGDVPASNFMFHFNFLQWDVANPRTTKPVFSCIRTFLRALFPNGFKPLYGFRNLNYCRFRQMEQLLFARTKKEFIYIGFLALSSNFSCQTLGDCLCTLDAFHISNSIRYFWASVCEGVGVCVVCVWCVCVYTVITNGFSSVYCACTIIKSRGQRYPMSLSLPTKLGDMW